MIRQPIKPLHVNVSAVALYRKACIPVVLSDVLKPLYLSTVTLVTRSFKRTRSIGLLIGTRAQLSVLGLFQKGADVFNSQSPLCRDTHSTRSYPDSPETFKLSAVCACSMQTVQALAGSHTPCCAHISSPAAKRASLQCSRSLLTQRSLNQLRQPTALSRSSRLRYIGSGTRACVHTKRST